MKKTIILISSILIGNFHSFSQTNLYWKVGTNAGLDFKTGTALVNSFDTCKAEMEESNTSICDNNGNLIFYSDAMFVYDNRDRIMPNGSNFNHSTYGNSYINAGYYPLTQGAITIPFPNDTNKFYVFYEDMEWNIDGLYVPSKLRYLIVDKTLNGGYGDVTLKDQIVIQNDTLSCGQLLSTKHGNGKDYWLIVRKYRSDVFYKILINSLGVQSPLIQHIGNPYPFSYVYFGHASICKNGDKLAYPTASFQTMPINDSQLDLFDFDRCTGNLKNYWTKQYSYYPDTFQFISVCFSPNNRFLYMNELDRLFQIDLNASNIWGSLTFIDRNLPANSNYWQMELGADNKIYCSPYSSYHYLHVINKPDSLGLACNEVQNQVYFGASPHWANGGLPNVPNFALGAINCNVGIEDVGNENNGLNIYPNPASDELRIKSVELSITKVEVMDLLGRVMLTKVASANNLQLSMHDLSNGIYLLKVTDEKGNSITKKIVKE